MKGVQLLQNPAFCLASSKTVKASFAVFVGFNENKPCVDMIETDPCHPMFKDEITGRKLIV